MVVSIHPLVQRCVNGYEFSSIEDSIKDTEVDVKNDDKARVS